MSSPRERAEAIAEQADAIAAENPQYPASIFAELIAQLANVVAETSADVQIPAEFEIGAEYELTLRVKAVVAGRGEGHDLCFELHLEQRDYVSGTSHRVVVVDADEIVSALRR